VKKKNMADPNDRHYAIIDSYSRKLTLTFHGQVIAESTNALILKEVGKSVYNPVFYFPKEDVRIALKPELERNSHCPIKGDASYWNMKNPTAEYFAWSYEKPLPRSKKIKGYIAFNLNDVVLISEPV
jgi:uncharacterized protein (DUF427 family)